MSMFDADLKDPKKAGKFIVNLYDNSKLHLTKSICSLPFSAGSSAEFLKSSSGSGADVVKPPKWFVNRSSG